MTPVAPQDFQGKVALVTGGGTGIGRAVALAFARRGADVAVCGPDPTELDAVAAAVVATNRRGLAVVADVGDETSVDNLFAAVANELGGPDVLVNNASVIGQVAPVAKLDIFAWNECLRVNLTGVMLCCRAAVAPMKSRGGGAVINVASNVARRGLADRAPYVCGKWAVLGLTRTFAIEVAPCNIRVNAINPGPVRTARLESALYQMAEAKQMSPESLAAEWAADSPMKRFATEDECAAVAVFLASPAASAITGQAVDVTCGMTMI